MRASRLIIPLALFPFSILAGCQDHLFVSSRLGIGSSFGSGSIPVGGVAVSGSYAGPSGSVTPSGGTESPWSCTTLSKTKAYLNWFWNWDNDTYGSCTVTPLAAPANWTTTWAWGQSCFDPNHAGVVDQSPQTLNFVVSNQATPTSAQLITNICYAGPITDPTPTSVGPQVVLDTSFPSSFSVTANTPITTAAASTYLEVFDTTASSVINEPASTIASNQGSATFPYPVTITGAPLPYGAYVGVIASISASGSQTVYGMQPFFVAHNDTTWPEAFGVAWGNNSYRSQSCVYGHSRTDQCSGTPTCTNTSSTLSDFPVVTLPGKNQVAIGSSSNVITVGSNPTAIATYGVSSTSQTNVCGNPLSSTIYVGPPNAIVVNTGSNSVSLIALNSVMAGPTGTVSVGNTPVAVAVAGANFAYVANWTDGTVSEINLKTVTQSRVLAVGTHPSSLWYDAPTGSLWVGGQGAMTKVSISSWGVTETIPVDGTVTSLILDSASGNLYHTLLQNGSASTPTKNGTMAHALVYSSSAGASYSALGRYTVSSGIEAVQPPGTDNSVYMNSPVAANLAFPGQLSFLPPSRTSSSNGAFIATVVGTNYSIIQASNGNVVVSGTMPSAIRSTAMASGTLYLTLPDSNSLVSIPFTIPTQ